ncbi:DUF4267 domain-containing protein [Chitinophaga sp.]|uniref:DUF4267 domain-containing protein n=1 Tax=Chitinophaga sp. TaxID=1869181 RepID=UPI0031DECBC8
MKTKEIKTNWGIQSASFWMTLLIAAGIIFIGARFIVNPLVGADGFGIPISSMDDLPFGKIKGIRDIFSGLVLLPFLFLKMRKAAAFALTTAIIVPATDFCIVLVTNGPKDLQHLLIHGLTVVYMIVTSILLFRENATSTPTPLQ